MAWEDTPLFFGTTKKRALGRVMIDAVGGGAGIKTKVMWVAGEKYTLRTHNGFPRIHAEGTVEDVVVIPPIFQAITRLRVPNSPGWDRDNVSYSASVGFYVNNANPNVSLLGNAPTLPTLFPADNPMGWYDTRGHRSWFNKLNVADAKNPTVTWGALDWYGPTGQTLRPRYPVIYLDGEIVLKLPYFSEYGVLCAAARDISPEDASEKSWQVVAILCHFSGDSFSATRGTTATVIAQKTDAASSTLAEGWDILGTFEMFSEEATYNKAHRVFFNSSCSEFAFVESKYEASLGTRKRVVRRFSFPSLTLTEESGEKHWLENHGTTITDVFSPHYVPVTDGDPVITTVAVPGGGTLVKSTTYPAPSERYGRASTEIVADVEYDGDTLVRLKQFADRGLRTFVAEEASDIVPDEIEVLSLNLAAALEQNRQVLSTVPHGWTTESLEAAARSALDGSMFGAYVGGDMVGSPVPDGPPLQMFSADYSVFRWSRWAKNGVKVGSKYKVVSEAASNTGLVLNDGTKVVGYSSRKEWNADQGVYTVYSDGGWGYYIGTAQTIVSHHDNPTAGTTVTLNTVKWNGLPGRTISSSGVTWPAVAENVAELVERKAQKTLLTWDMRYSTYVWRHSADSEYWALLSGPTISNGVVTGATVAPFQTQASVEITTPAPVSVLGLAPSHITTHQDGECFVTIAHDAWRTTTDPRDCWFMKSDGTVRKLVVATDSHSYEADALLTEPIFFKK